MGWGAIDIVIVVYVQRETLLRVLRPSSQSSRHQGKWKGGFSSGSVAGIIGEGTWHTYYTGAQNAVGSAAVPWLTSASEQAGKGGYTVHGEYGGAQLRLAVLGLASALPGA